MRSLLLSALLFAGLTEILASRHSLHHHAQSPRLRHHHHGKPPSINETAAHKNCAAVYTNPSNTVTGPGRLPKVKDYVVRKGSELFLHGKTHRIVGANVYWLGVDENVLPNKQPSYPSHQRIREAMAMVTAMGGNTIRAQSLGISFGNSSLCLYRGHGHFNEKAWDTIDYSIYAATQYGIRLIIPFVDQYEYYLGGKVNFLRWHGVSTANNGNLFYNTTSVIDDFKQYIHGWLNHRNKYSGRLLKNEPAIMIFETGNELGAYSLRQGAPPLKWTQEIASYIKSQAPHAIVIDGSDGVTDYDVGDVIPGVNATAVDVLSDHYYPLEVADFAFLKDQNIAATKYKKAFIIGEYEWNDKNITRLNAFYKDVESTTPVGDLMWSLFGHDDDCCRFIEHDDGYTLDCEDPVSMEQSQACQLTRAKHMPCNTLKCADWNGNITQAPNVLAMVQHFHRMTGQRPPKTLRAPVPSLLYSLDSKTAERLQIRAK